MPTSLLSLAPDVINLVETAPERRILDIGPGHGKYGLLLREYLTTKPELLSAVEAHRPYLAEWGPRLAAIYDAVYLANGVDLGTGPINAERLLVDVDPEDPPPYERASFEPRFTPALLPVDFLDRFNLVLLLDVIEHFPKTRALDLLGRMKGRVIINTPLAFFRSVPGHPTEEHVSHWTHADFAGTGRLEHYAEALGGMIVRLSPQP